MRGFSLKVKVTDMDIERVLEIPQGLNFEDLHDILQIVFGFENTHLHEFQFGNTRIVPIYESDDLDYMEDGDLMEHDANLDLIFSNLKSIGYTYDFGDFWEMEIEITPIADALSYPVLKSFKGNMLEDDCRGLIANGSFNGKPTDIDELNLILKETYY